MADKPPLPPRGSSSTTTELGDFRILQPEVGGALGQAYLGAARTGDHAGRAVLVRQVQLPLSDKGLEERLISAGRVARSLRHPKAAALLSVERHARSLLLVTESLDAEFLSLLQRESAQRRVPLPPAVATRIVLDVVQVLRAATEEWDKSFASPMSRLGVHGGLTPDCVHVAAFGEALVSELGVSATAARTPLFLRHPAAIGYRAPEQLKHPEKADERTDVFTLGVLFWELLANRELFGPEGRLLRRQPMSASEARKTEGEVQNAPIPRLDELKRHGPPVPKRLADLVAKALQRKPEDRLESLRAFEDALSALPPETIARDDQLAMVVRSVAHDSLEARNIATKMLGGAPPTSDAPNSTRITLPPGEVPAPMVITPQFTHEELPTKTTVNTSAEPPKLAKKTLPSTQLPPLALPSGDRTTAPSLPTEASTASAPDAVELEPESVEPESIDPISVDTDEPASKGAPQPPPKPSFSPVKTLPPEVAQRLGFPPPRGPQPGSDTVAAGPADAPVTAALDSAPNADETADGATVASPVFELAPPEQPAPEQPAPEQPAPDLTVPAPLAELRSTPTEDQSVSLDVAAPTSTATRARQRKARIAFGVAGAAVVLLLLVALVSGGADEPATATKPVSPALEPIPASLQEPAPTQTVATPRAETPTPDLEAADAAAERETDEDPEAVDPEERADPSKRPATESKPDDDEKPTPNRGTYRPRGI